MRSSSAGRYGRMGAVWLLAAGAGAALGALLSSVWVDPPPEPAGSVPPIASPVEPAHDLDRLLLRSAGPPEALALPAPELAPVAAAPPPEAAVPEPALFWILGLTVLYTLYLPPRSW